MNTVRSFQALPSMPCGSRRTLFPKLLSVLGYAVHVLMENRHVLRCGPRRFRPQ